VPNDYKKLVKNWIKEWHFTKDCIIVEGGEKRKHSVFNGLKACRNKNIDVILIHDAARPFIPKKEVIKAIKIAKKGNGAILAVPATDTVKYSKDSLIINETIDREKIWLAQTPQVFPYSTLLNCYEKILEENTEITDDASIFEKMNLIVQIILSTPTNFKITQKSDLIIADAMLNN
jgi:2-C-methyl-D-erythritol 4-phosphate cytidylyltransferase